MQRNVMAARKTSSVLFIALLALQSKLSHHFLRFYFSSSFCSRFISISFSFLPLLFDTFSPFFSIAFIFYNLFYTYTKVRVFKYVPIASTLYFHCFIICWVTTLSLAFWCPSFLLSNLRTKFSSSMSFLISLSRYMYVCIWMCDFLYFFCLFL